MPKRNRGMYRKKSREAMALALRRLIEAETGKKKSISK